MSNSAINAAMNAAEQAAAQAAPAAANLPAQQTTGSAVAYPVAGRKITTEDRIGGGLNVDHFLKFTSGGNIQVGQDVNSTFKSLKVCLDLSEVQAGFGISYEDAAGTLHYIRTTDGVSTDAGGIWEEEVAKARRIKPSIKPYNSWQIPFVLAEDAAPGKAGDRVGYTTVWSSFKTFSPVFDEAVKKYGKDAVVELELTCQIAQNVNKKVYGQAKFALLGEADQGGE